MGPCITLFVKFFGMTWHHYFPFELKMVIVMAVAIQKLSTPYTIKIDVFDIQILECQQIPNSLKWKATFPN